MRDPSIMDLVAYVCAIQPELDAVAAWQILRLSPEVRADIEHGYREQRQRAQQLLDLHLAMGEGIAA